MQIQTAAALAACAALLAPAAPALAATERDADPPKVRASGDVFAHCEGDRVRIEFRIDDASSTSTVVRVDGREARRSTRKRFAVRTQLSTEAHRIRAIARDASDNRFIYTMRLRACPS
jgi:hypothetical protein